MSKRRTVTKTRRLSLKELREQWPQSEDGNRAASLIHRYLFSVLLDDAKKADCNPVTAPAEAGANRALAKLVDEVSDLGEPVTQPPPIAPSMKPLNRFQEKPPEDSNSEKK